MAYKISGANLWKNHACLSRSMYFLDKNNLFLCIPVISLVIIYQFTVFRDV
ncbi:hypothetical protein Barb6XT_02813 [Bacteroidales bacterium Barb6XT]|nr:hypothetical protein Barb6XT_02813 [Bacteroidales bacterium Barb6XT]